MNQNLKNKLLTLPSSSGCYLMKNDQQHIIYVGKAKNLQKRVLSYFQKPHSGKTQKMVSEIADIDIIITNTETEALILELNLVQLHDPRYNVLLKDGKTFPYIQIKKTKDPYLKIARDTKDKTSKYFGPYPDSQAAYSILHLLQRLFPLRKCKTVPNQPCLYYYLGQCMAPCIKPIDTATYEDVIQKITDFMNGNNANIRQELLRKMRQHAQELQFEQANEIKQLIANIDYMNTTQSVQLAAKKDIDIFAYHAQNELISIATLIVRNGKLLTKITQVLPQYTDVEDVFQSYIMQFYSKNLKPSTLVLPKTSDYSALEQALNVTITTPTRGKHFQLVTMAAQNALKAMEDEQSKLINIHQDSQEVLEELGIRLKISYPKQIDFLDNSHTVGQDYVGVAVVFINGHPAKKMYRKYKINPINKGADDKAMYEVTYRRFYRHLSEKRQTCDLLLVDGGIIQVQAAARALNDLQLDVPVFGVVKDEKHQTRAIINTQNETISIRDHSALFMLVNKMQAEVHRYAITFHHSRRSKSMMSSILDNIPGLGPVRLQNIMRIYGTGQKMKETSIEELTQYVPRKVAILIHEALENS